MCIQNKPITIIFLNSLVLVVTQVLVMQWSIGKVMIDSRMSESLKHSVVSPLHQRNSIKNKGLGKTLVKIIEVSRILSIRAWLIQNLV
jgi:hypothetical protein